MQNMQARIHDYIVVDRCLGRCDKHDWWGIGDPPHGDLFSALGFARVFMLYSVGS